MLFASEPPTALFTPAPENAVESPPGEVGDVCLQTWAGIGDRDDVVVPLWHIREVGWFQSDTRGSWMYLAHPIPYTAFPLGNYTFKPSDLHPIGLQLTVPTPEELEVLLGRDTPEPKTLRPYIVRPREAGVARAITAAGLNWAGWTRNNYSAKLQEAMAILFADTPQEDWPEWPTQEDPLTYEAFAQSRKGKRTPLRTRKTAAQVYEEASEFLATDIETEKLF